MSEEATTVSVKILDKEYQVSCPAEEVDALSRSARYLDEQMRSIRESGKIFGMDRIAVMAALNMANDLLHAKARDELLDGDISARLKHISDRVESVLGDTQQLDL